MNEELVQAFAKDAEALTNEQLTDYKRGWTGKLPMAVMDAAYSQQTQYLTAHGKGLLPNLHSFQQTHPEAAVNLRALLDVPAAEVAAIVGHGKTNGRTKASAVLEVARNLTGLTPPVYTAAVYDHHNEAHRRAYTSVHGLGKVTYNYLGMLLGYPDVKPDTWIIAAVQRVADSAGIGIKVDANVACEVVTTAHEKTGLGETITHFDHAVWLAERARQGVGAASTATE